MAGIDPLSVGLGAVGLVSRIPGIIGSYEDEQAARSSLNNLRRTPYARYSAGPELQRGYASAMYGASNPTGFTGGQRSAFRQQLGSILNSRYAAATSQNGGSGARAVNAVLRGQANDAANTFAVNDANLYQQNRRFDLNRSDSYARQFQGIKDRNTAFDQNYRLQTEQALGTAIQRNKDYRRQTFNDLGGQALGVAGYLAGNRFGRTGATIPGAAFEPNAEDISNYTSYGRAGLQSRRNRFRELGAYGNTPAPATESAPYSFTFPDYDDGSPVRIRR